MFVSDFCNNSENKYVPFLAAIRIQKGSVKTKTKTLHIALWSSDDSLFLSVNVESIFAIYGLPNGVLDAIIRSQVATRWSAPGANCYWFSLFMKTKREKLG